MQLHIDFQQLYQFYKWIITLYIIGSSFQSLENQIFYFRQRKCYVIYWNIYFWIGRLEATVIIYPLLKKFRRSVDYKRSNRSLKILAYNENYCKVRTLRDRGEWRRVDRDFRSPNACFVAFLCARCLFAHNSRYYYRCILITKVYLKTRDNFLCNFNLFFAYSFQLRWKTNRIVLKIKRWSKFRNFLPYFHSVYRPITIKG